jgi:hypothetical protein
MTRSDISPKTLTDKGYKAYEFGTYTLEDACEYIRNGCECRLEPRYPYHMVGVVVLKSGGQSYDKDMFARDMTPDERAKYADLLKEQGERQKKVSDRIRARNLRTIRYIR